MEEIDTFRNKPACLRGRLKLGLQTRCGSKIANHTVCFDLGKGSDSGIKWKFLKDVKGLERGKEKVIVSP